jgi:endonuclease G
LATLLHLGTDIFNHLNRRIVPFLIALILIGFSALRAWGTVDVVLQMQLGNPSGATADTNNHNHFLIQRTVEALDYSDTLGEPVWASWDLTASDIGTNSRSTFITDMNLPSNFTRYSTGIYDNSGWDRGHLCPSKDRTDTSTNNDLVFLMSNVLPQNALNNSGVWLQFENYCRDLVQSTNNYELLLICGGSGYSGARLTNGPFIPDYVWKIAVIVPAGTNSATNRITSTNRVIAVKIPNNVTATNTWPAYVTSAAQIQVDTGQTFFTALPADVASALRNKMDGQTNPPPAIFSFSPASGAANTNVIILGTNFGAVSAVAFNGASAAFNVDSGTQISPACCNLIRSCRRAWCPTRCCWRHANWRVNF